MKLVVNILFYEHHLHNIGPHRHFRTGLEIKYFQLVLCSLAMMSSPGCCLPLLGEDLVSLLQTTTGTIMTGVNTGTGVTTGTVTTGTAGGGAAGGLAGLLGLGSGTALSNLFSTLLPGLGLGLLKGLFLAELLKPRKKGKSHGYGGYDHYKQRMGLDFPPEYPRYPDYLTPHSSDGNHYDGSF